MCLLLTAERNYAIVLDWNGYTWASGTLSQSFDIDAENPGNDVTITIQDPGGLIANAYPGVSTTPKGGYSNGEGALEVQMQLGTVYDEIVVTVTFHYADGVKNVNSTLFDIDKPGGGQPDQLRNFYATDINGLLVGPEVVTYIANTATGSGTTNVVVTGTANDGNPHGDGNLDYDFGTNLITQYTYTFGVETNGGGSAGGQIQFWQHDLRYQPKIPEVGTALMAACSCLGIAALRRLRKTP